MVGTRKLADGFNWPLSWDREENNPGITKYRQKQARKRAREERRGNY